MAMQEAQEANGDSDQVEAPEEERISINCLTKIQASDEEALRLKITSDLDSDFAWIKDHLELQFLPWESSDDGTEADILRIHKEKQEETGNPWCTCFFVDKQSAQDLSIIVAYPDTYTLLYADEAATFAQQLVKDLNWESIDYEIHEGLREASYDEFRGRAMTYGRIPAGEVFSVWANLDLANMGLNELVEMHGSNLQVIPDPDWDGTAFLKKVEELKRRERDEL